ncbi:uncharacterized protein LOC127841086 [Dreissena polymorpha]|uniref:Uncharacterized protein n=1 Tax=Dreissena polymorpha TaxID=45954 RepID=A0A9D4MXM9_DREPO|nr:uncharacterized protein LOC127841086 [Dreissena polymorpha]KAH3885813.1 hypothetical protein DPMN_009812 [Dreissena polymorpha]
MAANNKPGLSLVINLGLLAAVGASVCADNRASSGLIDGDDGNAVNDFLKVLRRTKIFILQGDNVNHNGCRKSIGQFVFRERLKENNQTWTLDCWEPTVCTLVKETDQYPNTLRLVPIVKKSSNPFNSWVRTQVNTVLLPIDERNTISYTFIPYVSQRSAMFVTALLTGCSVFVATSDIPIWDCNIIVMHANWFCSSEGNDENHVQATYVLQQVQATNQRCKYQIRRRWSADSKRKAIETHNYHYSNNITYYRKSVPYNFVYGYNLGGWRKWQFCLKELDNSAQQEKCNEIV